VGLLHGGLDLLTALPQGRVRACLRPKHADPAEEWVWGQKRHAVAVVVSQGSWRTASNVLAQTYQGADRQSLAILSYEN
jgi:hypothetical protein